MCSLYYIVFIVYDNNKYTNFKENISATTNISKIDIFKFRDLK